MTDRTAGGLVIVDVSDPSASFLVGSCTYDVYGYTGMPTEVLVYEGYAYIADYGAGAVVIDVQDPANPTVLGSTEG